jgi:hypothetical protein
MDARKPTYVVLEGGGAKGSYSCGALTVLASFGIQWVAVSGPSAGALNAIALSTRQISSAKRAWGDLTLSKVIGSAGRSPLSAALQVLCAVFVGMPCVFLNILSAAFSHRREFLRLRNAPIEFLWIGFVLLNTWLAFLATWPFIKSQPDASEGWGLFVGTLLLIYAYRDPSLRAPFFAVLIFLLPMSPISDHPFQMFLTSCVATASYAIGVALIEVPSRLVAIIEKTQLTLPRNRVRAMAGFGPSPKPRPPAVASGYWGPAG